MSYLQGTLQLYFKTVFDLSESYHILGPFIQHSNERLIHLENLKVIYWLLHYHCYYPNRSAYDNLYCSLVYITIRLQKINAELGPIRPPEGSLHAPPEPPLPSTPDKDFE